MTLAEKLQRIKALKNPDKTSEDVLGLIYANLEDVGYPLPQKGVDFTDGIDGKDGEKGDTGPTGPEGPAGKDGLNGIDGLPGKDGLTPVRTVDYWTTKDQEKIISDVLKQVKIPKPKDGVSPSVDDVLTQLKSTPLEMEHVKGLTELSKLVLFLKRGGFRGGGGTGGSGSSLVLQTNGVLNGNQSLLNLVDGTGISITDDGLGNITFDLTSVPSSLIPLTQYHIFNGDGTNHAQDSGPNFLWNETAFSLQVGDLASASNSVSRNQFDASQHIYDTIGTLIQQVPVVPNFVGTGVNDFIINGFYSGAGGTSYTLTITNTNVQQITFTNQVGTGFNLGDIITSTPNSLTGEVIDINVLFSILTIKNVTGNFNTESSIDNGTGTTADVTGNSRIYDEYDWSDSTGNSGSLSTESAQNTLSFGIFARFGSRTGHDSGDVWTWSYQTLPAKWLDLDGQNGLIKLWAASDQDPSLIANQGIFIQTYNSPARTLFPFSGIYVNQTVNTTGIASYKDSEYNAIINTTPTGIFFNYDDQVNNVSTFGSIGTGTVNFFAIGTATNGSSLQIDANHDNSQIGSIGGDLWGSFGFEQTFAAGAGSEIGFLAHIDPITPDRHYAIGDVSQFGNKTLLGIDDTNKLLTYDDATSQSLGFSYLKIDAVAQITSLTQFDNVTFDSAIQITSVVADIFYSDLNSGLTALFLAQSNLAQWGIDSDMTMTIDQTGATNGMTLTDAFSIANTFAYISVNQLAANTTVLQQTDATNFNAEFLLAGFGAGYIYQDLVNGYESEHFSIATSSELFWFNTITGDQSTLSAGITGAGMSFVNGNFTSVFTADPTEASWKFTNIGGNTSGGGSAISGGTNINHIDTTAQTNAFSVYTNGTAQTIFQNTNTNDETGFVATDLVASMGMNASGNNTKFTVDDSTQKFLFSANGTINATLQAFNDNASAVGGGLVTGDVYQTTGGGAITTAGVVMVVQ